MAAVVTKDVPEGVTVMGAPARPIEQYKKIHSAIKQIAGVE
jgi:acetyltransferase-like isoleucine patch superfamily enzyme